MRAGERVNVYADADAKVVGNFELVKVGRCFVTYFTTPFLLSPHHRVEQKQQSWDVVTCCATLFILHLAQAPFLGAVVRH